MAKGGHARSGPIPDPNALRRDKDAGEWAVLSPAGRQGDPPGWPLTEASDREAELWAKVWTFPQALMWEHHAQEHTVAMYVRRLAEAEAPNSAVALSTLVKQLAEALGLTIPGMRANRWRIGEVDEQQDRPEASPRRRSSARSRLKVVAPNDGA